MRKALLALLLSMLGPIACLADGAVFEATTTPTDFPILGWSHSQASAAKARELAERECNRVLTEKRAEGWNIGPCVPVKTFKDQCIAYARPKVVSYRSVTYYEVGETEKAATEGAQKLCASKMNEVCVAQFMACDGKPEPPPAPVPVPEVERPSVPIAAVAGAVCLLLGSLGYLYFFSGVRKYFAAVKSYFVRKPPVAATDKTKASAAAAAPLLGRQPPPAGGPKDKKPDEPARAQDRQKSGAPGASPAPAKPEPVRQSAAAPPATVPGSPPLPPPAGAEAIVAKDAKREASNPKQDPPKSVVPDVPPAPAVAAPVRPEAAAAPPAAVPVAPPAPPPAGEPAAGVTEPKGDAASHAPERPKSGAPDVPPAGAEPAPVRLEPVAALNAAQSLALQARDEGVNTFISVARHIYRSKGQAAFDDWIAITLDALPEAERKVMLSALMRTVFDNKSDAP